MAAGYRGHGLAGSIGLLARTAVGGGVIGLNHHDNIAGWTGSADELGIPGLAG
jgi:hypothetical protein